MKNFAIACICSALLFSFSSCSKVIDAVVSHGSQSTTPSEYLILKGQHYSVQSDYKAVNYSELKFQVKFDSSAIYQATDPANQEDINKLYGFADNNANHQQFSARFGWNWARNSLRVYAYVYNNGERSSQEIAAISIGSYYNCSITVSGNKYIFTVNDTTVEMPRASNGATASGYQLYPYFGGDETAPHDIRISIREL
jgi:hypothetical protein